MVVVDRSRFNSQLTLIPLGWGDATKNKYQHYSCYLLHYQKDTHVRQMLLDVGSSLVLANPFIQWDNLTHILLSHHHIDHTAYLGKVIQYLMKLGRIHPLTIICHVKAWNWVEKYIKIWNHGQIPKFLQFQLVDLMINPSTERHYSYRPLKDFSTIKQFEPLEWIHNKSFILRLRFNFAPARHIESCMATRLNFEFVDCTKENSRMQLDLVYSPDTSWESYHLTSFAQYANYWLLDTTFDKKTLDKKHRFYQKHHFILGPDVHGHSSPEYSAQLCAQAHIGTYLMGHINWKRFAQKFDSLEENLIHLARPHFKGNMILVKELLPLCLDWGSSSSSHSS